MIIKAATRAAATSIRRPRMRQLILGLVVVLVMPTALCGQKRLADQQPHSEQYIPERLLNRSAGEMALDVCGGRDKVYLNATVDPTNINLLWSLRQVGDAVMFVSRVDGMALDANGGQGNPYPREADPSNINHLWLLAKVGDSYMIWSKVTNVVLDANGGRGRPYLSTNPDPRNINHLWSLRRVGNWSMIVSKVKRQSTNVVDVLPKGPGTLMPGGANWQIGQPMPAIQALAPDGSPLDMKLLHDRIVVMSFWSIKDADAQKQFDLLRKIR